MAACTLRAADDGEEMESEVLRHEATHLLRSAALDKGDSPKVPQLRTQNKLFWEGTTPLRPF